MSSAGRRQSRAGRLRALTVIDILSVLADVPRATVTKVCEDTGRHPESVRLRMYELMEAELVDEAGRLPVLPGARGRGAMTYRLHERLRQP